MLPVLLLAAVDSQLTAGRQEADGGARLHEAVTALSEHIDSYVTATPTRSSRWRRPWPAASRRLRTARTSSASTRRIYPGFLAVFLADRGGHRHRNRSAVAGRRSRSEHRRPAVFQRCDEDTEAADLEVIIGRVAHVPIVTIAFPLVAAEARWKASPSDLLDLSKFRMFAQDFEALPDARVTIVDQENRVIYASAATGYTPLQTLTETASSRHAAASRTASIATSAPRRNPAAPRASWPRRRSRCRSWRVFVEQPLINLRLQSLEILRVHARHS